MFSDLWLHMILFWVIAHVAGLQELTCSYIRDLEYRVTVVCEVAAGPLPAGFVLLATSEGPSFSIRPLQVTELPWRELGQYICTRRQY